MHTLRSREAEVSLVQVSNTRLHKTLRRKIQKTTHDNPHQSSYSEVQRRKETNESSNFFKQMVKSQPYIFEVLTSCHLACQCRISTTFKFNSQKKEK